MRTWLSLLLLAAPTLADEALVEALRNVRLADRSGRPVAVERVLALEPRMEDLLTALADAPGPRAAPEAGLTRVEAEDESGRARPYYLFVPRCLAGRAEKAPLLVDLHGGVSRPDFIPHEDFVQVQAWEFYAGLRNLAEEHGFAIAFPLARADCVWWSDAGVGHLRSVVRDVKRRLPVDDDRIFLAGFSDGGSGCYYLAMAGASPFAGLLPMNGHPAVASRGSGRQLYLANARTLPLFVAMTRDDPLYPASTVLPHLSALVDLGAPLHLVLYPEGGHQPVYFAEQSEAIARFVTETRRPPPPSEVEWRCAEPALGTMEWLSIEEIGAAEGDDPEPPDLNPLVPPGPVRLGVQVDETEGIKITSVQPGSLAESLGMRPGDLLAAVDGQPVASTTALRQSLDRKGPGDTITVTIRREGAEVSMSGKVPTLGPQAVFPRSSPTAWVRARVEDGKARVVAHRNVRRIRVRLIPGLLEPGPGQGDGRRTLLEHYAREADSHRLVVGTVEIGLSAR